MIVKKNGTMANSRAGINFEEGAGITITAVDNPTANQIDVTITNSASAISTPVSVANGGTGRTTLTLNSLLVGNGTTAVTQLAAGADGQFLAMVAGTPQWTNFDCGGP